MSSWNYTPEWLKKARIPCGCPKCGYSDFYLRESSCKGTILRCNKCLEDFDTDQSIPARYVTEEVKKLEELVKQIKVKKEDMDNEYHY